MKYLLTTLFCVSVSWDSFAQSIEKQLFLLPDIIFEAIEAPEGFEEAYKIMVKQPLDHKDPSKGHFYQKVYLSHRGFDQPNVIITEGYNRNRNRIYELTNLIKANQLDVEHRFFGESLPEEMEYQYLTLEQMAGDLHRVRTLFGNMYQEKWVSTGISKGGSSTIFYRYFYPDDVVVSVPYVAPLNNAYEDQRIYQFLDTIGTDACRQAILEVQKGVLRQRDQVLSRLHWYAKGGKYDFSYHSLEEAFELTVLEYPFSFWQYGHDCSQIPAPDAPIDTLLDHLMAISDLSFFSDQPVIYYGSHYYQAANEMGYYGYETDDLASLLKAVQKKPYPHAAFVPEKKPVPFDGSLLQKTREWIDQQGDQFIYINGALDTWSATAVPPNENRDALWFFMPNKHHANARIREMNEEDRDKVMETLNRWLGL